MFEPNQKYYPPGRAGEFGMEMDRKRFEQAQLDKAMCLKSHGPGWTYNKTLGKCMMPAGFSNTGENVQDLLTPEIQPGDMPPPMEVATSPPEGGGDPILAAEINRRKANQVRDMKQPSKPRMAGAALSGNSEKG